jgi:hypothetical protein
VTPFPPVVHDAGGGQMRASRAIVAILAFGGACADSECSSRLGELNASWGAKFAAFDDPDQLGAEASTPEGRAAKQRDRLPAWTLASGALGNFPPRGEGQQRAWLMSAVYPTVHRFVWTLEPPEREAAIADFEGALAVCLEVDVLPASSLRDEPAAPCAD